MDARHGDFNDDDVVDGSDFMVWQRNFNPNCATPTLTPVATITPEPTVTVLNVPSQTPTPGICIPLDNSDRRTSLDQAAKRQEHTVINAIKAVKNAVQKRTDSPSKKIFTASVKLLSEAHSTQLKNWELSWVGPKQDNNCPQAQSCSSFVYTEIKSTYTSQAKLLRQLFNEAMKLRKQVRKVLGKTIIGDPKKDKALIVKADAEFANAIKLIDSVPDSSKVCN